MSIYVKKYIPNESTDYCESISIYFRTSHKYQTPENEYKSEDDSIYTEICGLSKNEFNIKNIKRWAEYKYAVLVKDNKISDTKIDVDKVKHLYLNNLVINDKQVESEKYNIEFIYNIEDKKYYTVVCFGTELSYNGGVKDYLQREIIEEYYSDTNYEIVNFKNKTTYKIGKNEYEVKWVTERKTFAEDLEYMKFYKNGKDMNIKNYEAIGNDSSGASYYRLISLDDFAKIMEMNIENIDQSTKTIYLVTR